MAEARDEEAGGEEVSSMTKPQLVVMWAVGLLLSLILFQAGIGSKLRPHFYNYFVGAALPVLILGACAFLTVSMKRKN